MNIEGYYSVRSTLGIHVESVYESEAVRVAQAVCAETKGQTIPDIIYVPYHPKIHKSAKAAHFRAVAKLIATGNSARVGGAS